MREEMVAVREMIRVLPDPLFNGDGNEVHATAHWDTPKYLDQQSNLF
jgi:hypothetical protein